MTLAFCATPEYRKKVLETYETYVSTGTFSFTNITPNNWIFVGYGLDKLPKNIFREDHQIYFLYDQNDFSEFLRLKFQFSKEYFNIYINEKGFIVTYDKSMVIQYMKLHQDLYAFQKKPLLKVVSQPKITKIENYDEIDDTYFSKMNLFYRKQYKENVNLPSQTYIIGNICDNFESFKKFLIKEVNIENFQYQYEKHLLIIENHLNEKVCNLIGLLFEMYPGRIHFINGDLGYFPKTATINGHILCSYAGFSEDMVPISYDHCIERNSFEFSFSDQEKFFDESDTKMIIYAKQFKHKIHYERLKRTYCDENKYCGFCVTDSTILKLK